MTEKIDASWHQIREKLSSILLAASLIRDGKAGPVTTEQREFSSIIVSEAETLHLEISGLVAWVRGQ
jgi:hypothetical protein